MFLDLSEKSVMLVYRAVGGITNLRIPRWGDEFGSCLMDYVPEICKRVEDKVCDLMLLVLVSHWSLDVVERSQ